jgi:hypothetical protein
MIVRLSFENSPFLAEKRSKSTKMVAGTNKVWQNKCRNLAKTWKTFLSLPAHLVSMMAWQQQMTTTKMIMVLAAAGEVS